MEQSTDTEIWQRMLSGEPRAFGLVWDRHRDRVFATLIAAGAVPSDAEDLTAMTFLESWRRRDAVRFVDESLLPWLLVTAKNIARNAERARRRYRAVLDRLPHPPLARDPADLVAESSSPRVAHARRVLESATERDRRLIALTSIDGLTVREAADTLGMGESAAKMRLSRLRKRLTAAAAPDTNPNGEN